MDGTLADCPQCGELVTKGIKFCPNCGQKLSDSLWCQPKAEFTCKGCKSPGDVTNKFCPTCGTKNDQFQDKPDKVGKGDDESKEKSPNEESDMEADQVQNPEDTVESRIQAMRVHTEAKGIDDAGDRLREVKLRASPEKDNVVVIDSESEKDVEQSKKSLEEVVRNIPPPTETYEPPKIRLKRVSEAEGIDDAGNRLRHVRLGASPEKDDDIVIDAESVEGVEQSRESLDKLVVKVPPPTERHEPAKIGSKRTSDTDERASEAVSRDHSPQTKKIKSTEAREERSFEIVEDPKDDSNGNRLCHMDGEKPDGGNMDGVNPPEANIERQKPDAGNIKGQKHPGANIERQKPPGANIEGEKLNGGNIERQKHPGANIEGQKPNGGNIEGQKHPGANIEGQKHDGGNKKGQKPDGGNIKGQETDGGNMDQQKPDGGNMDRQIPDGGNMDRQKPHRANIEGQKHPGANIEGQKHDGGNKKGQKPDGGNIKGQETDGGNMDHQKPDGGNMDRQIPDGGNMDRQKPHRTNIEGQNSDEANMDGHKSGDNMYRQKPAGRESTKEEVTEGDSKQGKKRSNGSDSGVDRKRSNTGGDAGETDAPPTGGQTRESFANLKDGDRKEDCVSGRSAALTQTKETTLPVFGMGAKETNTGEDVQDVQDNSADNGQPKLTLFDASSPPSVDLSKDKKKRGKGKTDKNTANLKEKSTEANMNEAQNDVGSNGSAQDTGGSGGHPQSGSGEKMETGPSASYADKLKSDPKTGGAADQNTSGNFYQKSDTAPDYVPPKTTSNKPKKGNNTAFRNEEIQLNFHVVVSPDFHFNPDKDHIHLGSDLDILGKWEHPKVTLRAERWLEGQFVLMAASVSLPKCLLSARKVEYKYVMVRENGKVEWEFLYKKAPSGNIVNRSFQIQVNELKDKDEWTLYDGVMHSGTLEKGRFKKIWNWITQQEHKKVHRETKIAAKAMLPRWNGLYLGEGGEPGIAYDVLLQITRLHQCFRNHFLQDDCEKYDEAPFKEVVYEYIQPRLENLKKTNAKSEVKETTEKAILRLASSVSILVLCYIFNLDYTHPDIAKSLLFGLTIRCDTETNECLDYAALIEVHFKNQIETVTKRLENFLNQLVKNGTTYETDWLRAVPLYHFLRHKSAPYKPLEVSPRHRTSEWWGTSGIEPIVKRFKAIMAYKDDNDMPLNFYLRVLGPLFEVDRLLPRTLVACMSWKHLDYLMEKQMIEVSVFFANMFYAFKSTSMMYSDLEKIPHFMELLKRKLTSGVGQRETLGQVLPLKLQELECDKTIAMDFMREVLTACKTTYTHKVVASVTETLLVVIKKYVTLVEMTMTVSYSETAETEGRGKVIFDDYEKVVKSALKDLKLLLKAWLHNVLPATMIERYPLRMKDFRELEIFDWLLNQEVPIEKDAWMEFFMDILKNRLDKNNKKDRLELFCRVDCDKHHPLIQDLFSKAAFKAIEEGLRNSLSECAFLFDLADQGDAVKFNLLLSRVFKTAWPKTADGKVNMDLPTVLCHILNWNSFVRYLEFFYGMEKSASLLDEETRELIVYGISVFETVYGDFTSGRMTVSLMHKLLPKHAEFTEICKVCDKRSSGDDRKQPKEKTCTDVFPKRRAELEKFEKLKTDLLNFEELCDLLGDSSDIEMLDDLKDKLKVEVHEKKLCDLCEPQMTGTRSEPKITWFQVPMDVLHILTALNRIRRSVVFEQKWMKIGRTFMRQRASEDLAVTLEDIVEHVWLPVYQGMQDIVNSMQQGTITFLTIDEIFGDFRHNYKEIKTEIKGMCEGVQLERTNWIDKKLQQIEEYQKLKIYRKGALTMKKIKEGFNLQGDFEILDILISAGDKKNTKLKAINEEVVKSGKALQGLTKEKSNCIEVFHKALPLVEWLKDSVKDTKEIKVLVDLAMMSAQGQGDMEVHRAQILHAAAVGYAPLIYELNPSAGFREFLQQCQQVWKSLESDPKLPDKLEDTALHLDWLKNVKESHGSVELDALSQAENINARGIYYVGCLDEKDESIKQTLEEVLQLQVPPERKEDIRDKDKWRYYKYEKLKDLQSKLMLVAGKAAQGKDQVDRFMEIFDGITRLGTTYMKLCKAGSILFRKWNVTFYCEPGRNIHTIVDFGLSGNKAKHGTMDITAQVSDQIKELSEFLDACLDEWQHDINVKRQQFYFLNYFTTEQLVILRKEIAACLEDETRDKVSPRIYPMLSIVKKNCTEENLQKAICEAMEDLEGKVTDIEMAAEAEEKPEEMETNEVVDEGVAKVTTTTTLDYSKADLKKYLEEMSYSGFTEKLALRALEAEEVEGPECLEEAIMWCMDHDDDSSEEEEDEDFMDARQSESDNSEERVGEEGSSVDPVKETKADYSNVMKRVTLAQLTKDLLEEESHNRVSLKAQLSEVWDNYMKVSATTSVSDFLSVEHLGYILQWLAELSDAQELQRPMPPSVPEGKPNLIVCPQGDMLQYVLSLYMYERGVNLRLPTSDEVLLCTPHTRLEEVELLFRRAVGMHKEGKIFCLVNADRLDYEVSKHAEKKLENYSKGIIDYRLVILCSRENEDKSFMVTAYDRYRMKNTALGQTDAIHTYLKNHFCARENMGRITPAAELDPEKSCVRVVKSERAGVGKSLRAQRLSELMRTRYPREKVVDIHVSLHRKTVDVSEVLSKLLEHTPKPANRTPRLIHINIAHEVQEGVDDLLFNLLVLGSLTDQLGYVWLKSDLDLYIIEVMPLQQKEVATWGMQRMGMRVEETVSYVHQVFHYLPSMMCWSPMQSLDILQQTQENQALTLPDYPDYQPFDQLMDINEFRSAVWQRVFQYLTCYSTNQDFNVINANKPVGNMAECIKIMLSHCGLNNPSWAELRHFVSFLNVQLLDCDNSSFCSAHVAEDLPGFRMFVVKSMIQMSRDFATRSLNISEQTPGIQDRRSGAGDLDIEEYHMKRRWETSPHPYAFFNADHHSMTFLGFNIDANGNMIDQVSGEILDRNVMPKPLQDALKRNRVPLNENFDNLQRAEKITKLCQVMGNEYPYDPDPTYVLTTDNTKKILAIYMRFRCGIPVIIMGETGCGKTRLIKFMCDLQKPPGVTMNNMVLMKVHGGTNAADIHKKIEASVALAQANRTQYPHVDTVVFFDEANTTEEIGLIKQVMCDQGLLIKDAKTCGLRIVAACNPYRRHSPEMIKKLEQAGLGYHIEADQTTDKLGQIPMRRLVYRVQALPKSMIPLVWDFGQLDTQTEQSYIQQMVNKFVVDGALPNMPNIQLTVSRVLTASQDFMRAQKDECSFVSLRDVERTLKVMSWFYLHRRLLFELMDKVAQKELEEKGMEPEEIQEAQQPLNEVTRCLVLALGVCYHACLENRGEYRQHIAGHFVQPLPLPGGAATISGEINRCQDVFLDQVQLEDNIARNQALKENLFMMIVCIELRIPLFLVGKPGSSKSLAKTIVHDAMQGDAARSELFREFKLVHMVSYQCSPLSTPDGIVSTFKQCAALQKEKNLDEFVSVVVLDEVGLAEDSPRMPLKTLHPLLEDGCEGDEESKPHMKVAFIGISNWALDPAKMNRGILVQRGVPNDKELQDSAEGICARNKQGQNNIRPYIKPMALAYLELYNSALEIREFFGLRDFYSIIKMVYSFSKRSGKPPTWYELKHSILRNFGGLDGVDPMAVFERCLTGVEKYAERQAQDPDCSPVGLIWACLFAEGLEDIDCESRYLLILTENYAALKILQQQLTRLKDAIYIFGSSFPKDQEYTQVCRNINRIKVCMETGQTVVLLNLESLYESLYDALNQYYVYLGGQRFVDLGLGSHRVKCKVHEDFRLIVVAEKQVVYKKFPIPLINRLEKHTLTMETVLCEEFQELARQLHHWAKAFAAVDMVVVGKRASKFEVGDVFIGYEKDTACSVVLQVSQQLGEGASTIEMLEKSQEVLLQCATPEAIVRLKKSRLQKDESHWSTVYFTHQQHDSLAMFLQQQLEAHNGTTKNTLFAQVSTHSKLLSRSDCHQMARKIGMSRHDITLESLQEFHTEQQFCKQLSKYFESESQKDQLLILQCDSGDENATLIASAQHSIIREFRNQQKAQHEVLTVRGKTHVVFIVQLPRRPGGCFVGFQGGEWMSYHIDELRPQKDQLPSLVKLKEHSVGTLFEKALCLDHGPAVDHAEPMEQMEEEDADMLEKYADMPPLEGYTEEDYIRQGHKPAKPSTSTEEQMEVDDDLLKPHPEGGGDAGRTAEQRHGNQQPMELDTEDEREFDVAAIIKNCIHGAASMLEDAESNVDLPRKTRRVQLLLQLLDKKPKEGDLSLIDVFKKRVVHLLKDKEQNATTLELARQWLTNEAASSEAISKAGTFIRSVWQNIEAKVTPILAYIIAYCDPNANLDLLTSPSKEVPWKQKYWLKVLGTEDIACLTYQGLQTASQRREVERFLVANHGCQETAFKCRLPFSWLIKEKVDLMVHKMKATSDGDNSLSMVVKMFHNKSSEGRAILSVVGPETDHMYGVFVQRYLSDYIRMVYKCHSITPHLEYQLIEEAVRVAALEDHTLSSMFLEVQQSDSDDDNTAPQPANPFLLTIPLCHVTYQQLSSRLRLFCQAVEAWPEAVEAIDRFKEENGDHVLNSKREFTLDILMLHFILENLAPQKTEINNIEQRFDWIQKVMKMSPIVEKMLASASEGAPDRHAFGEVCKEYLTKCRAMWSRVYAVQLFIEHVCPRDVPVEKLSTKKVLPLWVALGDDTDFQKVKSFEKLEQFLTICNKNANKHFFGESGECEPCGKPLLDPVKIPCSNKDTVCRVCIETQLQLPQPKCPICGDKLPEKFKPAAGKQNNEARDGYAAYRQRCNSFFMELVSSLCFPGDVPPENEVIKKLLAYVTKETKDAGQEGRLVTKRMNAFQDSIDPTPVVRSFLLQLLLRSHVDQVKEYLEMYFENARRIVGGGNQQHLVELCLLFVHCFEDANHTQFEHEQTLGRRRKLIMQMLKAASKSVDNLAVNVEKLEAIAGARFGLYIVADWMYKVHISKAVNDGGEMKKLFECASRLCNDAGNKWPRLYLLRQISRRFGMDSLLKLGDVNSLKWILPPEARQNKDEGQPDRFIMCEGGYREVREALTLGLLEKDFKKLDKAFKDSKSNAMVKERNLMLALYTEVTMARRLPEDRRGLKPEHVNRLGVYLTGSKMVKGKQLADALTKNDLGTVCTHLKVEANQDRKLAMISQLVVHYRVTLNVIEKSHFVEPLIFLMDEPERMSNCFLPTMPQDDLEYVHEALLDARNRNQGNQRGVDHNYVFYKCPNGHPYTIGDCGNPAFVYKCKECGKNIGGQNYQLEAGNQKVTDFKDAKSHGHILGPAGQRSRVPVPERNLTAATCAIVRLLSHMSMYLGASEKADGVGGLVVPPIPGREAVAYFWEHILVDLEVMAKALNRSPDDSVLLLHLILDSMLRKKENARGIDSSLNTKKVRQEWEKRFADVYIAPLLQGLEERLHTANQQLLNDDRLGSNPLMKILYEADVTPDDLDISHLQTIPAIWRIRSRVTIEHLTHELAENLGGQEKKKLQRRGKEKADKEYPVLMLFLQHEPFLRAVRFLPAIVRLQRLLVQRFHGAIDRAEATQLTVGIWMNRKVPAGPMREEYQQLIENFSQAWTLVKANLATFGFGGLILPKEYTNLKIDYDTPLAMLLPSYKGQGLCSIALVHYLSAVQNDFLENYSRISKISVTGDTSVHEATAAHLVSYIPDRDLLPLVLANCNYSLSVGKDTSTTSQGTSLQYDFRGLEKRVEEKFIRGRTRIKPYVEAVVFRADFTNAGVFDTIRKKINQEGLDSSVQQQIVSESKHLTEVTDSLATLDIALGFLVSVGGDGDTRLAQFISNTLEMKRSLHSTGATRHCRLKHVQALWLLLSQERAKIQAKYGQEALDNVADKYHEDLSQEQISALHNALQYCNPEHLLTELYECIMLLISIPQDENDQDYVDNREHPLGYVLTEYMESKGAQDEGVLSGDKFPADILLKHSVNTWLHINRYITQTVKH